ncbi:MAG: hypothetical protein R2720_05415 [Candidatus Nanopelagicales bacterium]
MTGMDVSAVLLAHATAGDTGRLDVAAPEATATILLYDGRLCSVDQSAAHPSLGMRLVSGGCLSLTKLGPAIKAQKQHPGMRLGDVLVRTGLVQRHDVEAVAWEQLCDDMATILRWREATATFTRLPHDQVPAPGPTVQEVLAVAGSRAHKWQRVVREIGGPDTVPDLSDEVMGTEDVALRPTDWAILCRIDGVRSLQSIAEQAGFTPLEAASILQGLIAAGLVTVPEVRIPITNPDPWQAPVGEQSARHPAPVPPPVTHAVSLPTPPAAADRPPSAPPAAADKPPSAPPAAPSFDQFDDPADLLRELSQLGSASPMRRGRAV